MEYDIFKYFIQFKAPYLMAYVMKCLYLAYEKNKNEMKIKFISMLDIFLNKNYIQSNIYY